VLNPALKPSIIATIMAKNLLWPFAAITKAKVESAAILAVLVAFAGVSFAETHSHHPIKKASPGSTPTPTAASSPSPTPAPSSTPAKILTPEDIAALMHWELRKLPVTSATEDAKDFLRVAKEHETELPPRFDQLSQEIEAQGIANFSDDRSKTEYRQRWEGIIKDTLERTLNAPIVEPSPSAYYTHEATHAKPSAIATVSAYPSAASSRSTEAAPAASAFFLIIFLIMVFVGFLVVLLVVVTLLTNRANQVVAPDPNETEIQHLVLDDLRKGTPTEHYKLNGFLPKKGEKVLWCFKNVKHYQLGTHSEWVGRSAGVSFRVAKGIRVRTGGSRGHKVSHSQMDYKGRVDLVFTTQGFSFVGAADAARIPLSRILAFQTYSDGFGLQTDYARNNHHLFRHIHANNVVFLKSALDLLNGNETSTLADR
jgi:hypothetical protein